MKIQRRVINKETGEEEGTYQLIKLDNEFYWSFTNYPESNIDAPTLYLSRNRNKNKTVNGLGVVLYFREEDFENSTTNS